MVTPRRIKNIQDLLLAEYGVRVDIPSIPATITVATTKTLLTSVDVNRAILLFVNLGTNPVFVFPGEDVSTTRGIRLTPSGGSLFMGWRDDLTLPSFTWWAVTDAGTSAVVVLPGRIS